MWGSVEVEKKCYFSYNMYYYNLFTLQLKKKPFWQFIVLFILFLHWKNSVKPFLSEIASEFHKETASNTELNVTF